jgi:hypothetical protein
VSTGESRPSIPRFSLTVSPSIRSDRLSLDSRHPLTLDSRLTSISQLSPIIYVSTLADRLHLDCISTRPYSHGTATPTTLPRPRVRGLVCNAFQQLRLFHQAGYVHGDVKMENFLVGADDAGGSRVLVADVEGGPPSWNFRALSLISFPAF